MKNLYEGESARPGLYTVEFLRPSPKIRGRQRAEATAEEVVAVLRRECCRVWDPAGEPIATRWGWRKESPWGAPMVIHGELLDMLPVDDPLRDDMEVISPNDE